MTSDIIYTSEAGAKVTEILNHGNYNKIAVLVDENTRKDCYPLITNHLSEHIVIEIKSGEINKTLDTCGFIWQELTHYAFDRKSILINLGGGVIGDMGGFCASTYKRGIDFINIPTTLLSQVDASVGGKLGIDFNGYKNHIGLFRDPNAVIIDQTFLKTLPSNELRSGFAEVIKHHLIADHTGWVKLNEMTFPKLNWSEVVPHSVKIKSDIVNNDPYEGGLRKVLNFGHTIGHAIESYLLNEDRAILHGEAIAAGMICEGYLSVKKGFISNEKCKVLEAYILSVFDKTEIKPNDLDGILSYLIQDKKNKKNKIMASLLENIGKANWDIEITSEEVSEAINYYNSL